MNLWANNKLRLAITSKCNINCFYCHNDGQPRDSIHMSDGLFNLITDSLTVSGNLPEIITFTGGEPLTHPNIFHFIKTVRPFCNSCVIVTNGILLSKSIIKRLIFSGITTFRLGIDSFYRARSRPSHSWTNTFSAIDTVNYLLKLKTKVEINTVLTDFNKLEIPMIVNFCYNNKINLKIFEHINVSNHGNPKKKGTIVSQPVSKFEDFHELIINCLPHINHNESLDYGACNYCYWDEQFELRYCKYLCDYKLCYLSGTRIDANGYVFICMKNRGQFRLNIEKPFLTERIITNALEAGCYNR